MDEDVRRVLAGFAAAVIAADWPLAESMLPPWYRDDLGPDGLRSLLERGAVPDASPPHSILTIDGNSSGIDDLRQRSALIDGELVTPQPVADYIANGGTFTNIVGLPRFEVAEQITPTTFVAWCNLMLEPDPALDDDLDYCLEIWVMVVRDDDGGLRIGHIEPEV